jgi:hypothetical protein
MTPDPNSLAQLFLKYDYTETKDLAKSFLTLTSGLLVFSVSFSERAINAKGAALMARISLGASWVLMIIAIVICGLAICFLSWAAGEAVYGGSFEANAFKAYGLLFLSGCCFVVGLLALVVAAIVSLARPEARP